MDKREKHVTLKINAAKAEALTKSKSGDKKGAIFAVKKIKMYEEEVTKIQGTKITLETQIMALESAATNISVFEAMNQGTKTLASIHKNM